MVNVVSHVFIHFNLLIKITRNKELGEHGEPRSKETVVTIARRRETSQTPIDDLCQCNQIDPYGTMWNIPVNTTLVKRCKEGSVGIMNWTCDYVQEQCQFHSSQPDYSQCLSLELLSISNDVRKNCH